MSLEHLFLDPPAEYRQRLCWIWHQKLDLSVLTWQLSQMAAQGLGGVVVQARPGFLDAVTEAECHELLRGCQEHANALGLQFQVDADGLAGRLPEDLRVQGAVEVPGVCPAMEWSLRLQDLKGLADRQVVQGGPVQLPHKLHASLVGAGTATGEPSFFFQSPWWFHYRLLADYTARLNVVLANSEPAEADGVMAPGAAVSVLHRCAEDKHFYFLVNGGEVSVDTRCVIPHRGRVQAWDLETGVIAAAAGQTVCDTGIQVPLHLAPGASVLLEVDTVAEPVTVEPALFEGEARISVGDAGWHFTPHDGNCYRLNLVAAAQNGGSACSTFRIAKPCANLRLITSEEDLEVRLDGAPVSRKSGWEIDPGFAVWDLRERCDAGEHQLDVTGRGHTQGACWLAGDFAVDVAAGMPVLSPVQGIDTGAWEDQGFACFSGTAAYADDVMVPKPISGNRVCLNAGLVGGVLEVEVNGQPAGVRAWPPWRVDVTEYLWLGEPNLVVIKVTNTGANFFGEPPADQPSGLLAPVWLEIL